MSSLDKNTPMLNCLILIIQVLITTVENQCGKKKPQIHISHINAKQC